MFKKILVALDPEVTGTALFEKAVSLAQATDANLMLLSVLTPDANGRLTMTSYSGLAYYPSAIDESIWDVYQERYQESETRGLEILRGLTEQATTAGVRTEFTQLTGSPGRAICDLAKTWEADLVMVGSHGRKGLNELLMGSVSSYVMHHASCSVLVIHEQTMTEKAPETVDLETAEADG